jgi:hypothetical protein
LDRLLVRETEPRVKSAPRGVSEVDASCAMALWSRDTVLGCV